MVNSMHPFHYLGMNPVPLPKPALATSPSVPPPSPTTSSTPDTVNFAQAPLVIRRLSKQLGMENKVPLSQKEMDISHIQDIADATTCLQHLLAKTAELTEKYRIGQSHSQDVTQLSDTIAKLEARLLEMHTKKTLSIHELQKLQKIEDGLQTILSSLNTWHSFQANYLAIEQRLEEFLAVTSDTTLSELYGCSPETIGSVHEGLRCMHALIVQAAAFLDKTTPSPFAPELGEQLLSNIYATCFGVSDWSHAVDQRSERIFDKTLAYWDDAVSALSKDGQHLDIHKQAQLQEAATLLLMQRQMLEKAEEHADELHKLVQDSLAALPPSHTGVNNADLTKMQRELHKLAESLAWLKVNLPEKRKRLETAIEKRQVTSVAEPSRANKDQAAIDSHVQQIISAYAPSKNPQKALHRYIATKRALLGFESLSQTAKAFCQQEEMRLTFFVGYATDFKGMAYAQLLEERKGPPGFLANLWQTVTLSNASERTRRWVHTLFTSMQLSHEALKIYQQLPSRTAAEQVIGAADRAKIEKEKTWLSSLMTQKYAQLASRENFEHLTKRSPEIRETLRTLLAHYPPTTSKSVPMELHDQLLKGYENHCQQVLLGQAAPDAYQWIEDLDFFQKPLYHAALLQLPDRPALAAVETIAKTAIESATDSPVELMQDAAQKLTSYQQQINQCSRAEYLQPKTASTPQALIPLRQAIALIQHSLRTTMLGQPQSPSGPAWATWQATALDKCYEVKMLETRLAEAMQGYEEAIALGSLQPEYERTLNVYGNKHANLEKTVRLQAALNLAGIETPAPRGIENSQIHRFLQAVAPDVFTHWEALKQLNVEYQDTTPFFRSAAAAAHLEAIAASIENAFTAAGKDEQTFQALGLDDDTMQWLNDLSKAGFYLMVRSTGAEDTKENANAGGNISVAYVAPQRSEFCAALGKVVSSYFGADSLQNRLNTGLTPFQEELRLAVTAQQLIGEPIGGAKHSQDIPISLVMFTNEPFYIGEDEFRAMRISATFGHGEGVVGNQGIGGDTVLVLHSAAHPDALYIIYDNKAKPERLAPQRDAATGRITLQKTPNPGLLAQARTLSNELLVRLFEWGIIGEKFFGNFPTDMEIVIKNGKIYPVQARPVVRPTMLPTFLDAKKLAEAPDSPVLKTFKLSMITPGKASVVEIEQAAEIETADILENAEKQFDKKQHKLVVVGQSEPANSHPVVNFSGMGMPCLWTKDMAAAQEFVAQVGDTIGIAVCVQSARMFLWDKSKGSIADYTSEGFVVHPADIAESLPISDPVPLHVGIPAELTKELSDILFRLQTSISRSSALQELHALRSSAPLQTFHTKLAALKHTATAKPMQAKALNPIINAAQIIEARLAQSFDEIEALLNRPRPFGQMELLLHAKILEALLYQNGEAASGIAQHSVATLTSAFAAANLLVAYQQQLDYPAHFLDLLLDGTQSPIENTFEQWQQLLLAFEASAAAGKIDAAAITKLKHTIETMRKADVLAVFMTFFLQNLAIGTVAEKLQAITEALPPGEEPLMQEFISYKGAVARFQEDVDLFGDPKTFPEAWEHLQGIVAHFLPPSSSWMEAATWNSLSPIAQNTAMQLVNELVDLYDLSIKALKSSTKIEGAAKVKAFKQMLEPYLQLLNSLAVRTGAANSMVVGRWRRWTNADILERVVKILDSLPDDDIRQLSPSHGFSVAAAVLGSGTDFERFKPRTLEDCFTFIHQSLLATTSTLVKTTLSHKVISTSGLPAMVKELYQAATSSMQFTGAVVTNRHLSFHFNKSLRQHSAKLSIDFDRISGQSTLTMAFTGNNESQMPEVGETRFGRWNKGMDRLSILNAIGYIQTHSPGKISEREAVFTMLVDSKEHVDRLLQVFSEINIISMNENDMEEPLLQQIHALGKFQEAFDFAIHSRTSSIYSLRIINEFITKKLAHANASSLSDQAKAEVMAVLVEVANQGRLPLFKLLKPEAFAQLKDLIIKDPKLSHQLLISALPFLHQDYTSTNPILPILDFFIDREFNVPIILESIRDALKNELAITRYLMDGYTPPMMLLCHLVANGHAIEEGIAAIKHYMLDPTTYDSVAFSQNMLDLLAELIKSPTHHPQLKSIIAAFFDKTDKASDRNKRNILSNFAKKHIAIPEAIDLAVHLFQLKDLDTQLASFDFLLDTGNGLRAIEAISTMLKSTHANKRLLPSFLSKIEQHAAELKPILLQAEVQAQHPAATLHIVSHLHSKGVSLNDYLPFIVKAMKSDIPEVKALVQPLVGSVLRSMGPKAFSALMKRYQ